MILELTAKTSIQDLTIEFIQLTTKQGESISLNWETSYITRDSKDFQQGMCLCVLVKITQMENWKS